MMAIAKDARQYARTALHGIGNSLYSPVSGRDGDDIDWNVYRTLVRHCVGALGHPGRPDYFTHWGGAYKYAASVLGLSGGAYPESWPPRVALPDQARDDIRAAYRIFGMVAS